MSTNKTQLVRGKYYSELLSRSPSVDGRAHVLINAENSAKLNLMRTNGEEREFIASSSSRCGEGERKGSRASFRCALGADNYYGPQCKFQTPLCLNDRPLTSRSCRLCFCTLWVGIFSEWIAGVFFQPTENFISLEVSSLKKIEL